MKEKVLIGAGGSAREIKAQMRNLNIKCFVDDQYWSENTDNVFPISQFDPEKYIALITLGSSQLRYEIAQCLPKETEYFTFIHPSVNIIGYDVVIGEGSIICANSILMTNVTIGKHAQLNIASSISHDSIIGDFFTTAPGARVTGQCELGNRVYLGTNTIIKDKINVCDDVIIGMGAVVVKHISESGTYIGVPAKKIK